jgi:translation initiation factor 1 (eIF-1/SUI1)
VKGQNLEIQGDQRLLCQQKLQALGYVVKLSGG